jgi:hypothetical protein
MAEEEKKLDQQGKIAPRGITTEKKPQPSHPE